MISNSKRFVCLALMIALSHLIFLKQLQAESTDSSLKQKYQDAITAGEKANQANMITIGLWAGAGALCGYNCFNYLSRLTAARNAVLTASQGLTGAVTSALTQCPAATGAGAAFQSANAQLTTSIAAAQEDIAIAAAETATIAQGGVSTKDTLEEQIALATMNVETSVGAVLTSLTAAANTAAAACELTGASCVMAETCANGAAAVTTAESIFTQAVATYTAMVAEVTSVGKVCAFTSMGVAAGDLGISMAFGQKLSQSLASAAGAAPAVYSLMKAILSKQTPVGTASSLGVGSCLSAAGALLEVGVKTMNMSKTSDSIKKNKNSLKKLEVLNFSIFPYAFANEKNLSNILNIALQSDSVLAKAIGTSERQTVFFGAIDRTFRRSGASAKDFLTDSPIAFEKVAQLMTQGMTELTPKVIEIYKQMEKDLGTQQPERAEAITSSLVLGSTHQDSSQEQNPLQGTSGLTNNKETLFQSVSRGYQQWKQRLKLEQ